MKKNYFIICFFFILSCNRHIVNESVRSDGYTQGNFIEFCDLPNHKNQIVTTEGIYSGIQEYWSLYPVKTRCVTAVNVELNLDSLNLTSRQKNIFNKLSDGMHLRISAKGTYKDDKKAYGHLGSNQAEFVVRNIYSLELVESRKDSFK